MELKPGYKQTEVGVIPEDWDIATFDKVADIIDPQPDHRTPPETSGGEPYIGISDFINDTFVDWDGCRKIISKALDKQQKSFQIGDGDIIFGKIGTIGFPKFLPITSFRYALSANVILIKPKIAPHFLMSWLKSRWIQKQIDQDLHSTSQAAFGILKMRKLLITLPPPPEQKAIATALSDIDNLLGVLDRLIAKKQNLKQSSMQALLTGKKRLSGLGGGKGHKETEVGLIPEDWNIKKIKDCTEYVDYRGKTPAKTKSGRFLVTAKNIREGFIDYEISKEYVAEDNYELIMRRGKPQIGDILITTEAPLGNVAAIDREDIALAQRVIKYKAKSEYLDQVYLKHYFLSATFQRILDDNSSGSTAKGIKGSILHKLPVLIPSLPEQRAIANILSDMDTEITALKKRRDKTLNIKQAMMQELLTGKTRLVSPGGIN